LRAFEYRRGSNRLEKNKEENYTLYSSPNIIRMVKSRKIGWVGHGIEDNTLKMVGKPERRNR
jgi:hypothetical protein